MTGQKWNICKIVCVMIKVEVGKVAKKHGKWVGKVAKSNEKQVGKAAKLMYNRVGKVA